MSSEDSGFDLRAFLVEQARVGQLDSEGGFTIAAQKAAKKLAFFGLPQEYDWVLKVVQAANLWRVPQLLVTQSRVATSFAMAPDPQPSQATLAHTLAEPTLSNTDPIHALAMALRSLVEQVGLSFVLAIRRNGESEAPIYAGDDVSQLSPGTRARWGRLSKDGIRLTVSHFRGTESTLGRYLPTFSQVERRDVAIMQILQRRAFPSSVPIVLDGRRINSPAMTPFFAPSRGYRLLRTGSLDPSGRILSHNLPWEPPASQLNWLVEHPDRPWYVLRGRDWRYPEIPPSRSDSDSNSHRLLMTRQGVVCRVFRVPNSFSRASVLLVAPSDHCRSDLSGLALELSNRNTRDLRALRRQVAKALEEFVAELKQPSSWEWATDAPGSPEGPVGEGLDAAGSSIFSASLTTPVMRFWTALARARENLSYPVLDPTNKMLMLEVWTSSTIEDLKQTTEQFASRAPIEE
jgi:hypothetical protein